MIRGRDTGATPKTTKSLRHKFSRKKFSWSADFQPADRLKCLYVEATKVALETDTTESGQRSPSLAYCQVIFRTNLAGGTPALHYCANYRQGDPMGAPTSAFARKQKASEAGERV